MEPVGLVALLTEALSLSLWLSLPVLVAAALAGVFSGVLQGATGVSDPTLGFVPRVLAVALAIGLLGPVLAPQLLGFTTELWAGIAELGR